MGETGDRIFWPNSIARLTPIQVETHMEGGAESKHLNLLVFWSWPSAATTVGQCETVSRIRKSFALTLR